MSGTSSQHFEVPVALDGERVDRVLALASGCSRRQSAELIAAGVVRVGDRVVASRHEHVVAGTRLQYPAVPRPERRRGVVPEPIVFRTVYEDDEIVVVDKPAGVVVHPGSANERGTLVSGLLAKYPGLAGLASEERGNEDRPGIVHRLDKDTSGLLVVALSERAVQSLTAQLATRAMTRQYDALALGHFDADEGSIDAPVGRSLNDRTKMAVVDDGRPARTHYRVIRRFVEPFPLTLLEISLETGRTHQIRVHLAAIGRPVAGDTRYKGARSKEIRRALGVDRPFLHAARLRLIHPASGKKMEFASALPSELSAVLERLEALEPRRLRPPDSTS